MPGAACGTSRRATRSCARAAPTSRRSISARVQKAAETSKAEFRDASGARTCSASLAGILEGEILRDGRRPARRDRGLRDAPSQLDDALTYDEPEPLPFAGAPLAGRRAARGEALRRRRARLSRGARRTTRTTAGRCSACSRRSPARARRRPRSTPISPRAGRAPTRGSGRRGY